jgi:uncharacterized protein with PIN domain
MPEINESNLVCLKCNRKLEYENTNLYYMEYRLANKFLRCPVCKQVYIPEEIVLGKMAAAEASLEDK